MAGVAEEVVLVRDEITQAKAIDAYSRSYQANRDAHSHDS